MIEDEAEGVAFSLEHFNPITSLSTTLSLETFSCPITNTACSMQVCGAERSEQEGQRQGHREEVQVTKAEMRRLCYGLFAGATSRQTEAY